MVPSVFAQYSGPSATYSPPPTVSSPAPTYPAFYGKQNVLYIDGRHYNASVGGVRDYMRFIEVRDPELHQALFPEVQRMRRRRATAWIVGLAGVGLGTGLMLAANEDQTGLFGTGFGIALASPIVWWGLLPGKKMILDFVNTHNGLASKNMWWTTKKD